MLYNKFTLLRSRFMNTLRKDFTFDNSHDRDTVIIFGMTGITMACSYVTCASYCLYRWKA